MAHAIVALEVVYVKQVGLINLAPLLCNFLKLVPRKYKKKKNQKIKKATK